MININIRPFPAVRVNWKWWRFTERAKEYHNNMNILRALVNKDIQIIRQSLLDWNYEIIFYFEIPKSKKKTIFEEMPHTGKPDIDNLYKAFTDTMFYWYTLNDSNIWKINAIKRRWLKDKIVFCN